VTWITVFRQNGAFRFVFVDFVNQLFFGFALVTFEGLAITKMGERLLSFVFPVKTVFTS